MKGSYTRFSVIEMLGLEDRNKFVEGASLRMIVSFLIWPGFMVRNLYRWVH